jgi:hypothetical protein
MSDKTEQASSLSLVKDGNILSAKLASAANPILIERLAVMAQMSDDPEVVRRAVETLHKVSTTFEEKKATVVFTPAQFAIVLDDNIPQLAPPKRETLIVDEVVDIPPPLEIELGPDVDALPPELDLDDAATADLESALLAMPDEET